MDAQALKDPSVLFALLVVKMPLALHAIEKGLSTFVQDAANYLLSPTMIASYIYFYMVVTVCNQGNPVKLSARDQRAAYWYLMNGVYFTLFFDVFAGQFQVNGLLTSQYNILEPRYKFGPIDLRGQSVFWTSMSEICFQSPFAILVYYAYKQGKAWRRPLEIIFSLIQIAGVWWFYVPEAYAGFPHTGGWPKPGERFTFYNLVYFWFGFWFMGLLWTIVNLFLIKTAFLEITSIIDKHDSGKGR